MYLSLLLFIFSAVLVYFSSRSLIKNLIRLFYRLTRSQNTAINLLFFLLLPGVFLHEFAHILTAEVLRVPTGELSLKPQFKNNQLRLGSAQIALTDPIRLTLIGTAPFLLGTITLWLLLTFGLNINLSSINLDFIKTTPLILKLLFFYLTFSITNTMFSSPSDLQAAGLPIVLFLLIFGSLNIANLNPPLMLTTYSTNLFTLLATIFFLVLALNLIILFPLKILNRHS